MFWASGEGILPETIDPRLHILFCCYQLVVTVTSNMNLEYIYTPKEDEKYKVVNNRPSSVNPKSLVYMYKHNIAGDQCLTQDNTDTRETQVWEQVPKKSKLHMMWPCIRHRVKSITSHTR